MLSCTKLCHVLLYCIWSAHNMINNNRASIQLSDFHMEAVNFLYDWNPSYEFWGKRSTLLCEEKIILSHVQKEARSWAGVGPTRWIK